MKIRFPQICAMLVAGTLLLTACNIFPQKEATMDDTKLWFQPHDEILYPYIDEVKAYLEAGIKTQLDLQTQEETFGRTESTFPGAAYRNIPIGSYGDCFLKNQLKLYREVFQLFADPAAPI